MNGGVVQCRLQLWCSCSLAKAGWLSSSRLLSPPTVFVCDHHVFLSLQKE
jgi:hypothetical protein